MGARSTSSPACTTYVYSGLPRRAMGGREGARYEKSRKVPCALSGSSGRSRKDRPEVPTRKFPLGSFHSEVPPRSEVSNRGSSGRSQGSVGLHRQPPSRAPCCCWCKPFSPVPLGCSRWKSIALSLIVGVDNALAAQCYWIVARGEGGGDLRRAIRRAHTRLQESGAASLLKETEATFLTLPASAALRCGG